MQINYHLVLTKIQKLQNWKKKKNTYFYTILYRPKHPKSLDMVDTRPIFKPIRNVDVSLLVHVSVRYISVVPASTVRYGIDYLGLNPPSYLLSTKKRCQNKRYVMSPIPLASFCMLANRLTLLVF